MPSPRSDRSLRRLVAELASAASEDVEAVLAELDPGQRSQVQAMLTSYLDGPAAVAEPLRPSASLAAVGHLDGLSPWLAARLQRSADPARDFSSEGAGARSEAPDGGPFGGEFIMTAGALDALQAAALELRPQVGSKRGGATTSPSLLERLHGLVLRGGVGG